VRKISGTRQELRKVRRGRGSRQGKVEGGKEIRREVGKELGREVEREIGRRKVKREI
jgi:hypothetical protein